MITDRKSARKSDKEEGNGERKRSPAECRERAEDLLGSGSEDDRVPGAKPIDVGEGGPGNRQMVWRQVMAPSVNGSRPSSLSLSPTFR